MNPRIELSYIKCYQAFGFKNRNVNYLTLSSDENKSLTMTLINNKIYIRDPNNWENYRIIPYTNVQEMRPLNEDICRIIDDIVDDTLTHDEVFDDIADFIDASITDKDSLVSISSDVTIKD